MVKMDRFLAEYVLEGAYAGAPHRVRELASGYAAFSSLIFSYPTRDR